MLLRYFVDASKKGKASLHLNCIVNYGQSEYHATICWSLPCVDCYVVSIVSTLVSIALGSSCFNVCGTKVPIMTLYILQSLEKSVVGQILTN